MVLFGPIQYQSPSKSPPQERRDVEPLRGNKSPSERKVIPSPLSPTGECSIYDHLPHIITTYVGNLLNLVVSRRTAYTKKTHNWLDVTRLFVPDVIYIQSNVCYR